MKSLKIKIGPVWIEFGPNRLVFGPREARFRGRHFTLLGDDEFLSPHVTQPRGRFWRKFLPKVPVARFQTFFEGVGEDLFDTWCNASLPTTPETLAEDDWVLLGTDDRMLAEHLRREIGRDGAFTFRPQSVLGLWDALIDSADTPLKLHDLSDVRRPLMAVRVSEDAELESKLLSHYPHGLRGGPPGWYATPRDWLHDEHFLHILRRRGGRGLFDAMAQVQRLLGIGSAERIDELRRA